MRASGCDRSRGFSLIELLIAVAIVGILAAIAYPGYTQYIIGSRRVDAQQALTSFATAMERWRAQNMTYAGAAASGADTGAPAASLFPSTSPVDGSDSYYNLTIESASSNSFVLRATPINGTSQEGDGYLELLSDGRKRWDADNSGAIEAGETQWD